MKTTQNNTSMKFLVTKEIDISAEQIGGLLEAALYGGSNYWYLIDTAKITGQGKSEFLAYRLADGLVKGTLTMPVYDVENPEDVLGVVDRQSFKMGLTKMYMDYPEHFSRCFEEDGQWDAEDADVFFQFITMGEVIYG